MDGAAVVLIGSRGVRRGAGIKPRARIRAMATVGAEPVIMLTAPAPASQQGAGERAGMDVGRHRPLGDQRGLRRGAAADDPQPRHRSRPGQRQRRRDRARPSAGRDRRDPARHRPRRARAARTSTPPSSPSASAAVRGSRRLSNESEGSWEERSERWTFGSTTGFASRALDGFELAATLYEPAAGSGPADGRADQLRHRGQTPLLRPLRPLPGGRGAHGADL